MTQYLLTRIVDESAIVVELNLTLWLFADDCLCMLITIAVQNLRSALDDNIGFLQLNY
jgi:hypothetical protein